MSESEQAAGQGQEEGQSPQGKESKADHFRRLAQNRTANALKAISLIGNLSNRATYEYSAEQIEKIMGALKAEVDRLEEKFKPGEDDAPAPFTL